MSMEVLKKKDELKELDELLHAKRKEIKDEQEKLLRLAPTKEHKMYEKIGNELNELEEKLGTLSKEYFSKEEKAKEGINDLEKQLNHKKEDLKEITDKITTSLTNSEAKISDKDDEISKKEKKCLLLEKRIKKLSMDVKSKEKQASKSKDRSQAFSEKEKILKTLLEKLEENIKVLRQEKEQMNQLKVQQERGIEERMLKLTDLDEEIDKQKLIILTLLAREDKVKDMARRIKKYYERAGITINDL